MAGFLKKRREKKKKALAEIDRSLQQKLVQLTIMNQKSVDRERGRQSAVRDANQELESNRPDLTKVTKAEILMREQLGDASGMLEKIKNMRKDAKKLHTQIRSLDTMEALWTGSRADASRFLAKAQKWRNSQKNLR